MKNVSFGRMCDCLGRGGIFVSGCAVMATMLVLVANVVGRYMFNAPIPGAIELSRTLLVVIIFLGLAYVQANKAHIRVDIILTRLTDKLWLIFDLFALVIALAFFALISAMIIPTTYHSVVVREFETGLIHFPMWPGRLALSIGLLLLVLQLVADIKVKRWK